MKTVSLTRSIKNKKKGDRVMIILMTILEPQTWTSIAPVPTSQEFLDIVLSRTQRRLPTQIRAGFKITRIRSMHPDALCLYPVHLADMLILHLQSFI